ncbi:MAG: hypothetical protein K0B10_10865 [Vicingaceae bacterium]|nr:hypothetical protein [Vicingaceae bacterium]
MKKIFFLMLTVLISLSCENTDSKEKMILYNYLMEQDYLSKINASKKQIRKEGFSDNLVGEDDVFLKYSYVSNTNITINSTYLFDEKGCFEIGLDIDYENIDDANSAINQFKQYVDEQKSFINFKEDNYLLRWINQDKSRTVEVDIANASSGKIAITIFANE